MLASNVLKLRLDRIEQQEHHLSVKNQLRLVTLAQPELTAGLYTHLFYLDLPKDWNFRHQSAEDIACSLRLIRLINQVFMAEYPRHAQRYHWFEQGLAFTLQYANQTFTPQQLQDEVLPQLAQCQNSSLKLSLLKQLQQEYGLPEITLALAQFYMQLQDWSMAIQNYRTVLEQQPSQAVSFYDALVQCLLQRHCTDEHGNQDAVVALQYLIQCEQLQQSPNYQKWVDWAVSLIVPESLKQIPPFNFKSLNELQQKLKFLGNSLNHWLLNHDFIVPYQKHVVEHAPKLLSHHEIVVSLDRHKAANQALQKILQGRDLKLVNGIGQSSYHLGFIWNYLQVNPLVLDALVAASQGNPETFYNLKQIAEPEYDHQAALTRVSAYLAKQQVAYNLSQQGHSIEFAEHSQFAGFDLIVDGTPMQVKCTLAADDVEEFVKQRPHIAVIVNIELAHLQEKYTSIFVDLALSYESVQRTAQISLQQGGHTGEFLPIPLMNMGFAVYRNFSHSQSTAMTRPYTQAKASHHMMKNSVAVGAALGGVISGSIGVFVVSGLAVYRTWRIQKNEQRKPLQQQEQLRLQCNKVTDLLVDFAEWFNQHLLQYRVDVYAYQLQQIESKLMGKIPETVIASTLFAYKFAVYQRALQLQQWMQKQLQSDQPQHRAQAGWVALAHANQFMSVELKRRVTQLNRELAKYKSMIQSSGQSVGLPSQPQTPATSSPLHVPNVQMNYEVSSKLYRS